MTVERGSFSTASTGNLTVLFANSGLTAEEIEFSVGPSGSSDTDNHICLGYMNGSQQTALSTFSDTTGEKTAQVNNKCISHYTRSGGTITEIIAATRVSIATAGEFTINFSAANVNYTIYFRARSA